MAKTTDNKNHKPKSKSKSRSRRPVDPTKVADIDERTRAVFTRKGYRVDTMLGRGSFGEVYKGVKLSTGEPCAVKMMNLLKMSSKFKQRFLPRELASLMEIKHPNIVRVWDIFRSNRRIYVFMEFAIHGDLAGFLKSHQTMSELSAKPWFGQIAIALNYLHEEMFTAHRDIKIDNILLTETSKNNNNNNNNNTITIISDWIAKLTDFGFATDQTVDTEGYPILSRTYCGTVPYYSPQIVTKKPYSPFKADVWAHGVVLYAMTHNRFPFHFKDTKLMVKEQNDINYRYKR